MDDLTSGGGGGGRGAATPSRLEQRRLRPGAIGFGTFKIGRNTGIKYPAPYDLPTDDEVAALLDGALALGINLIDTAPAYGTSEERIGRALAGRRDEYLLSTKVGENYENGLSTHDFSRDGMRRSVERSLRRLGTDRLDFLLLHSSRNDLHVVRETEAPAVLGELREAGVARAIGLSGYTAEAAREAMAWADVLMLEFNPRDTALEPVIDEAAGRGVAVFVKKGLASGHLPAAEAVEFALSRPGVTSLVVGGLNLENLRANCAVARRLRG